MSRVSASRLRRRVWMLSVVIPGIVLGVTGGESHAQGAPPPHRAESKSYFFPRAKIDVSGS